MTRAARGSADSSINNEKRLFAVYLLVLAALGGILVLAATSTMGPGVSTDAAQIMSTAENVVRGAGLVEYAGRPLTQFPPLYSLILAAGSWAFQADVLNMGMYLNAAAFAALIWLCGTYLRQAIDDEPVLAWVGSLVILTSTSLLQISANIASDPLFLVLVVLFLMSASQFLRNRSPWFAILAAVLAILSCFQRYAGLSLVISGGLLAAYTYRKHAGKAAASALLFVILTGAPIALWGVLHNEPVNGTIFGARLPPMAAGNLTSAVEKILYWFIPYRVISGVGPLALSLLLLGAAAAAVAATGARRFTDELQLPEVVPNVAFLLVYLTVLVFNISYSELKGLTVDRVHIIMLPSLLMVLSVLGRRLLQAGTRLFGARPVRVAVIAAFVLWSVYPISKSVEYLQASMTYGDVSSYNSINKGNFRTSALAEYLGSLDLKSQQIYTNGLDSVWLLTRTNVHAAPILATEDRDAELRQRFEHWPGPENEGYLVWIYAEAHKPHYATPEELRSIADLLSVYSDERATVYRVRSR